MTDQTSTKVYTEDELHLISHLVEIMGEPSGRMEWPPDDRPECRAEVVASGYVTDLGQNWFTINMAGFEYLEANAANALPEMAKLVGRSITVINLTKFKVRPSRPSPDEKLQ